MTYSTRGRGAVGETARPQRLHGGTGMPIGWLLPEAAATQRPRRLRIAARDTLPRRAWLGTSYHTAAIVLRAARFSMAIARRSSIISALYRPWIVRACRIRHHGLTFVRFSRSRTSSGSIPKSSPFWIIVSSRCSSATADRLNCLGCAMLESSPLAEVR